MRREFAVVAHGLESLGQIRLPFGKALREHAPRGLGLVGQFAHERAERAAPGTLRRPGSGHEVIAPPLQAAAEALTELGVKVVALSVDDEETSAALVAKHKLRFPVGHSADAGKVASTTGAYVNDDPHYLQSTGFVLAPDGRVRVAVYSSDAIGRLVADDVAGYIRYLTEHAT